MASPASTSSGDIRQKRSLAYGTSSRKRPINGVARDSNLGTSRPALGQSGPRSSQHGSIIVSSRADNPRAKASSTPKGLAGDATMGKGPESHKRSHDAAFAPKHAEQSSPGRRSKLHTDHDDPSTEDSSARSSRLDRLKSTPSQSLDKERSFDSVVIDQARQTTPRRPRLIDALAAQKSKMASDNGDNDETGKDQSSSNAHHLPSKNARVHVLDRREGTPSNRKVRFTYSQARNNVVSEPRTPEALASPHRGTEDLLDPLLLEPQAVSPPAKDPFSLDESDEEQSSHPAIKSVHELRRAGANHRFADELDDLISRIGRGAQPPIMRRNALCELVQKLQRKDFLQQFRDHASRDTIARNIGDEDDIFCAFALASALLCFLHAGPAPHLLRQLASDGVGKLLAMLLRHDEDIATISQSAPNVPRSSRIALEGVRKTLMELSLWHDYRILKISPRTAALQLMLLLSRYVDAALLDQIILDAQSEIISLTTWASDHGSYKEVDYALTVFTLATQSSAGVTPRLNSDGRHSARIAKLITRAFQHWPNEQADLDSAILKLALNTTNTEGEAAAFNDPVLLARLASRVNELFENVHDAIEADRLESVKYDELLLVLGVLINIMEHCAPARRTADETTMNTLTTLWREKHKIAGEADSVEKSKLSVAVGYLSVLLGYMCLAGQVREQLENCVGRGGLQTLNESITQFTTMYKAVDNKVYNLDALVDQLRGLG